MEGAKVSGAGARPMSFAFIFAPHVGATRPSLPVARALVKLGHRVHYLSREEVRETIEQTGATFHSEIENMPALYSGRSPCEIGALQDVKREYGMGALPCTIAVFILQEINWEMMLPGVMRWLWRIRADAVLYCPLWHEEAAFACKFLGIPRIALLTSAGPGSLGKAFSNMAEFNGITPADIVAMRRACKPALESMNRLNSQYGLSLSVAASWEPAGKVQGIIESTVTLVTASEHMYDPVTPELAQAFEEAGVRFVAVGALSDVQSARKAAGHKFHVEAGQREARQRAVEARTVEAVSADTKALLKAARAVGRKVILLSVVTPLAQGDCPKKGKDGKPCGPTGEALCRAAMGGAFDAFGAQASEGGPLLLVVLGPRPDALGELRAPPNSLCLPVMPQAELLKAGVDLFLTHGGRKSFTEALSAGVPMVVCPGFADQRANGQRAVDLGVGLQVKQPMPQEGRQAAAAAAYRWEVAAAVREVLAVRRFREAAARCAEGMRTAGGVPRAVELLLEAAAASKEGKGGQLASAQAAAPKGLWATAAHLKGA